MSGSFSDPSLAGLHPDEDSGVISGWEEAISEVIANEFAADSKSQSDAGASANANAGAADDAGGDAFRGSGAIPQEAFIPQPEAAEAPLINLESMDSALSGGDNAKEDEAKTGEEPHWLSVVSSSSSKGSQGSYADQVPALSGSGSTAAHNASLGASSRQPTNDSNGSIDAKRSDLGSPWTLPGSDKSSPTPSKEGDNAAAATQTTQQPKEDPFTDVDALISLSPSKTSANAAVGGATSFDKASKPMGKSPSKDDASVQSNISDMVNHFTEPKKSTDDSDGTVGSTARPAPQPYNLDEIFAVNSKKSDEIPTIHEDIDDPVLLAISQHQGDELAATPATNATPAPAPESASTDFQSLDPLAAPVHVTASDAVPVQDDAPALNPTPTPSAVPAQTEMPPSLLDDPLPLPGTGQSFTQQSMPNASVPSAQDSVLTPQPSGNFKRIVASLQTYDPEQPAAQAPAKDVFSAESGMSRTTDDSFLTSPSQTPRSGFSKETEGESTLGTSRGGTFSAVETETTREGATFSQTGTGTSFSNGETFSRTTTDGTTDGSRTNPVSPGETTFSRGDTLSRDTTIDNGSVSQTETDRSAYVEEEKPEPLPDDDDADAPSTEESEVGGRMWRRANRAAKKMENKPMHPKAQRFAENLMVRTQSRADPDAVVSPTDPDTPNMIRVGDQQDEEFILNTAVARKRVRVVQLLMVGLVSLLVAFLGSFWVQSSCHFVSASVEVGQNAQVFDLHYGLWKYSPIDSAFQGYSYCYEYDDKYTSDAPLISRWSGVAALVAGVYALSTLWIYLIFGRGTQCIWNTAVAAAAIAGVAQMSTLFIFLETVCSRDTCTLGPAGVLSVISSVVYFILAFEMHYNTPMATWVSHLSECPSSESPGRLMANLEMTDFKTGAKEYVQRIVSGDDNNPYPTLNQIQRDNMSPMGEGMQRGFGPASPQGSYKPPALIV